jgi:hypothetical protein
MRMKQQETGGAFNYVHFKQLVDAAGLSPFQTGPLQQRLDTLESFMPKEQTSADQPKKKKQQFGNDWTPKVTLPGRRRSLSITDIHRLARLLLSIYLALA